MRSRFMILFLGFLVLALSACGSQNKALITPAPDRLTFLFFFTDG